MPDTANGTTAKQASIGEYHRLMYCALRDAVCAVERCLSIRHTLGQFCVKMAKRIGIILSLPMSFEIYQN